MKPCLSLLCCICLILIDARVSHSDEQEKISVGLIVISDDAIAKQTLESLIKRELRDLGDIAFSKPNVATYRIVFNVGYSRTANLYFGAATVLKFDGRPLFIFQMFKLLSLKEEKPEHVELIERQLLNPNLRYTHPFISDATELKHTVTKLVATIDQEHFEPAREYEREHEKKKSKQKR